VRDCADTESASEHTYSVTGRRLRYGYRRTLELHARL
jgi:hypothetical protein